MWFGYSASCIENMSPWSDWSLKTGRLSQESPPRAWCLFTACLATPDKNQAVPPCFHQEAQRGGLRALSWDNPGNCRHTGQCCCPCTCWDILLNALSLLWSRNKGSLAYLTSLPTPFSQCNQFELQSGILFGLIKNKKWPSFFFFPLSILLYPSCCNLKVALEIETFLCFICSLWICVVTCPILLN